MCWNYNTGLNPTCLHVSYCLFKLYNTSNSSFTGIISFYFSMFVWTCLYMLHDFCQMQTHVVSCPERTWRLGVCVPESPPWSGWSRPGYHSTVPYTGHPELATGGWNQQCSHANTTTCPGWQENITYLKSRRKNVKENCNWKGKSPLKYWSWLPNSNSIGMYLEVERLMLTSFWISELHHSRWLCSCSVGHWETGYWTLQQNVRTSSLARWLPARVAIV